MGKLKLISSAGQYRKYTHTTDGGKETTGVHVFTTNTSQSIAAMIERNKTALANMNPANVSPSKVIAKINGGMMNNRSTTEFYGFYYQGDSEPMYIDGEEFDELPSSSILYSDFKYYPSFCVKSDGTAMIRWFSSKSDAELALRYCDYVIGAAHPIVYKSKNVFTSAVREDAVYGGALIYDSNDPGSSDSRFNPNIDYRTAQRTLLGHKTNKTYVMVATDGSMSIESAAELMCDLQCDYAVNLDGGGSTQMRVASGYGPTSGGKVTAGSGRVLNSAIAAYIK